MIRLNFSSLRRSFSSFSPSIDRSSLSLHQAHLHHHLQLGQYSHALDSSLQLLSILPSHFGETSLEHASILLSISLCLKHLGQMDEALRRAQQAWSTYEALEASAGLSAERRLKVDEGKRVCAHNVGCLHLASGELDEASHWLFWALSERWHHAQQQRSDSISASAQTDKEPVLARSGNTTQKRKPTFRGLARPGTISSGSNAKTYALETLDINLNQQSVAADKEAIQLLMEEIHEQRHTLASFKDPNFAITLHNLAVIYQRRQHFEFAVALQQEAVRMMRRCYGSEHTSTATALSNLAYTMKLKGDYQEALSLNEQALGIRSRNMPATHPDVLVSMQNLAENLRSMGQEDKAQEWQNKILFVLGENADNKNNIDLTSLNINDR